MAKKLKKNGKFRRDRNKLKYEAFVAWIAMPKPLREPKTQREFAEKYGVDVGTLTDWKNNPQFWQAVHREHQGWGKEKTGNVIAKMYQNVMKSNRPEDVRIWIEYFEGFADKINLSGSLAVDNPLSKLTDTQLGDYIRKRAKILKIFKEI